MIGRVRLWSAYVLFFYVVTHLLNHALGLISLRVLEVGRTGFVFIWHNPVGQTVLYGALFTHFFLALWSLYRRRALRLSYWEWTQLVLGALIIPLGAIHVVGTRLAHELYGVEPGYPWVLGSLVASDSRTPFTSLRDSFPFSSDSLEIRSDFDSGLPIRSISSRSITGSA